MAEAALDLRVLSRTFEKSNQDFRKAANDNNNNLSRIVKDIAKTFTQQRKDISSIEEAISESINEQQATSAKVDRLANIFGESITLQSQMVVQLKNIASGMNAVNDNIVQMSNAIGNPSNPIQGSLLGTLSGMALGAGVAGMGQEAFNTMTGPGYKPSGGEIASGEKVVSGLMQRGFSKEEAAGLAGNISAESRFNSGVTNQIGAFGLMQWLGSRKKELFSFAQSQGKSPADLNLQLDFIKKELKGGGGETEAFNRAVKESGGDVRRLAYLIGKYVERPADWELAQSRSRREGVAGALYEKTGSSGAPEATKQESAPATPAPQATPAATTPQEQTTAPITTGSSSQGSQASQNPMALSEVMPHGHGPISSSLEVKGGMHGQAFAGGDVHPGVMALASKIQQSISGFNRFTAFNDAYHHRVNPGSKHAQGLAADFTIKDPSRSEEAANQIRQMMQSMGISGRVMNEYTNPSAHATGGHIHVQFDSAQEAEKFRSGKISEPSKEQGKSADTAGKPETKNMVEAPVPPSRPAEYSTTQPATPETATPAAVPTAMPTGMGIDPSAMMGMLGGLGGMGNIGGMLGTAMPMLGGILNALGSSQNMPQMFASTQPTIKSINEAAVQSQAAMEQNFAGEGLPDIPAILDQGIQNMGRQMFASYNNDQDLGWPSWAANIGGWNWGQESKKVKYNMNQIG